MVLLGGALQMVHWVKPERRELEIGREGERRVRDRDRDSDSES